MPLVNKNEIKIEAHVAPMAVGAPFHSGKIIRVVCADTYVRWQLLTQRRNNATLVHDSWNTYGPERTKEEFSRREELIREQAMIKRHLSLLPSGDLEIKGGKAVKLSHQEFRDDDPLLPPIVYEALQYLKEQGIVINGIVDGERGLFLDIDKILEFHSLRDTIDSIQIFPDGKKDDFLNRLDKNNKSSYRGKIPITRRRSFGIPTDEHLLEGDSYYRDARFSSSRQTANTPQGDYNICVAPLIIAGLLPYIRSQYDSESRIIDFISGGLASSVRFNLVSILLNRALGLEEPYRNIHLFYDVEFDQSLVEANETDADWAMKMRYIIFDRLSNETKKLQKDDAHMNTSTGSIYVRDFDSFMRKLLHFQEHLIGPIQEINDKGKNYLLDLGFNSAMNSLDFVKAFKLLQKELYKRSKQIREGVSENDYVLQTTFKLFFPDL